MGRKGCKVGDKSLSSASSATSHRSFKEKAKTRVNDLQGLFTDLQEARRESRSSDAFVLEEQVQQILREWKAELDQPSPASSLNVDGLESFSSDIRGMLQQFDEVDDATSLLAQPLNLKSEVEPNAHVVVHENYQVPHEHEGERISWCADPLSPVQQFCMNKFEAPNVSDSHQFPMHQEINHNDFTAANGSVLCGEDAIDQIYGIMPAIYLPPSAFLGPKCALWDCLRPAQGSQLRQDYCSSFHAGTALNEGQPGTIPVMRCGGIVLKDGLLFSTLIAKTQGKNVGIPECEGAATTKSPWNTPELFDICILDGETMREWLFLDKPRRAFESGNRKQRSLPDYNGRGWHESRKLVMKEFGGMKRSYYMDPQPMNDYEWHLFVYEVNDSDTCALYRLELKRVDGKKSPKLKSGSETPVDLQKQMRMLSAELQVEDKQSIREVTKADRRVSFESPAVPNKLTALKGSQDHCYQEVDPYIDVKEYLINFDEPNQRDQHALDEYFDCNIFSGFKNNEELGGVMQHFPGSQASSCPPSFGPKCALWDCSRPALGLGWCQHFCSTFHATLAQNEGQPGVNPVQRPGGIGLKDTQLFAALNAKIQGKDVGIPECEGAATNKSPWNAPELFDISLLENEAIREWLFFDKPRKAFESGHRKQRSLPDYNGRGWHASRRQLLKEFGGVRRSYYMDPQPQNHFQWHLYEYVLNGSDFCMLYRLEFKLVNEEKISPSRKGTKKSPLSDLQKQLRKLTTDFPEDKEHFVRDETLVHLKDGGEGACSTANQVSPPTAH